MYTKTDTQIDTEPSEIVVADASMECNPVAVFLSGVCPSSRKVYWLDLRRISGLLGVGGLLS